VTTQLRAVVGRGARSDWAERLARLGLVARGVFYLVLAALAARVASLGGSGGRQADVHGALELITGSWPGKAAVAVASLGFGLLRLHSAYTDTGSAWWQRAPSVLQGGFYVVLAWVPLSFLFGDRSTGSEQQEHANAAKMLGLPGGRVIVVVIGVVVVVSLLWQVRGAVTGDYTDGLRLRAAPPAIRWLARVTGAAGIPARALVMLPVGVFLVVAAVQYDPRHADGLDGELLALSRHEYGVAVIALAALGLVLFATYSFLEARYRDLHRAR
jgi:hypothetical protein